MSNDGVAHQFFPPNRIVGDAPHDIDMEFGALNESPKRILKMNLEYIGNLSALRAWYQSVRLPRIPALPDYEHLRIVTQAASELLSMCVDERVERLRQYLEERSLPVPRLSFVASPCPLRQCRFEDKSRSSYPAEAGG